MTQAEKDELIAQMDAKILAMMSERDVLREAEVTIERKNDYVAHPKLKVHPDIELRSSNRSSLSAIYGEWINGDQWIKFRETILSRHNYICCFCGGSADTVHHIDYQSKGLVEHKGTSRILFITDYLNEYNVVPVCNECHGRIEKYEQKRFDEYWASLSDSEKELIIKEG